MKHTWQRAYTKCVDVDANQGWHIATVGRTLHESEGIFRANSWRRDVLQGEDSHQR